MDDLISRKAVLDKFNRKSDMWNALTDEETSKEFWLFCRVADALDTIPSVPAVPLEPLAEWIVDNLDPRCTCELCKSDPENAYRDCAYDDCPHMTEEQVKELLVKWMEAQDAR